MAVNLSGDDAHRRGSCGCVVLSPCTDRDVCLGAAEARRSDHPESSQRSGAVCAPAECADAGLSAGRLSGGWSATGRGAGRHPHNRIAAIAVGSRSACGCWSMVCVINEPSRVGCRNARARATTRAQKFCRVVKFRSTIRRPGACREIGLPVSSGARVSPPSAAHPG